MKFTMNIESNGAAFEEEFDRAYEVSRLLREVAEAVGTDLSTRGVLFDVNGNQVGAWALDGGER